MFSGLSLNRNSVKTEELNGEVPTNSSTRHEQVLYDDEIQIVSSVPSVTRATQDICIQMA